MSVSSTIAVDMFSKVSLDVIISFVDIPCLQYVTRFFICLNILLQIKQHLIVVDQKVVTINDHKVLFYMCFWH